MIYFIYLFCESTQTSIMSSVHPLPLQPQNSSQRAEGRTRLRASGNSVGEGSTQCRVGNNEDIVRDVESTVNVFFMSLGFGRTMTCLRFIAVDVVIDVACAYRRKYEGMTLYVKHLRVSDCKIITCMPSLSDVLLSFILLQCLLSTKVCF